VTFKRRQLETCRRPWTITGVDDAVADGNVAYTIVTAPATSSDANYSGENPADVSVTNTDNDVAGITVSPTSGPRHDPKAGGTAAFSVAVNQPADGQREHWAVVEQHG